MDRPRGDFYFNNYHGVGANHHQQQPHFNYHQNNMFNGDGFRNGGGGGFRPVGGRGFVPGPAASGFVRKRGFHNSDRVCTPDHVDRGSYVKLYVASIPTTVTENDLRPLFEEHGNVVDIVILRDKRTGLQHGACFVKYSKVEEAERAIKVLHKLKAFPSAQDVLIVRYAEGERERLGLAPQNTVREHRAPSTNMNQQWPQPHIVPSVVSSMAATPEEKLYIGGLNNNASKKEIEDIFSAYGVIEDIFIPLDVLSQIRGFGFIKYSHRDMALAAINALNGIYIMRGHDHPLIVRFADPKKPRNGDSWVNSGYDGPNFGSRSQEPVTMVGPYPNDPMGGGHMLPNASCPVRSNFSLTGASPEVVPHLPPQTSSQLEHIRQEHPHQPLMQNTEQKQRTQMTPPQQPIVSTSGESATVLTSNICASQAVPETTHKAGSLDCDWSEHTCPNGGKYYYNCITCESRWDKPEEYASFEQLAMKQLKTSSCQQDLKPVVTQSSTNPDTICV